MEHTLSILLRNDALALSRLTGLLATRGHRIHFLSSLPTADNGVAQLIVTVDGTPEARDRVVLQIGKLFDVLEVRLLGGG